MIETTASADPAARFDPEVVEQAPTIGGNVEFLRVLSSGHEGRLWVTGFAEDPSEVNGSHWGGKMVWSDEDIPNGATNSYFSVALFDPGAKNRNKQTVLSIMAVVLDDIATEDIPANPSPTWTVETSPHNYQVGFALVPGQDHGEVERLLRALTSSGFTVADKSGNSICRYVRLPRGVNTKAAVIQDVGTPFPCRLEESNEENRYTVSALATAFGVRLDEPDYARDRDPTTDDELRTEILSCKSFHGPLTKLSARMVGRGMEPDDVAATLFALMDDAAENLETDKRREEWKARREEIPRTVASATDKFKDPRKGRKDPASRTQQEAGAADLTAASETATAALTSAKTDRGAVYTPEALNALLTLQNSDPEEYGRIRAELRALRLLTDVEKKLSALAQKQARAEFDERRTPETFVLEGGDLHLAVQHADNLLAGDTQPNRTYQRGGLIVRVTRTKGGTEHGVTREAGAVSIVPMETPALACRLTELGDWRQTVGDGVPLSIDCPRKVADAYSGGGTEWSVPVLNGTIEAPTLRADGSVLDQPGYDSRTGLLYDPGEVEFGSIPDQPSRDDALAAVSELCKPLKDFPFCGPESKSVAVAAVLTALARRSMASAPMFAFSAPKMGSGKSLLADVVSMVLTGRRCAVMAHETNSEAERKRLLAVLMEGDPVVCLDNISRPLESDAMCMVLTQASYKDRLLGQSRNIVAPTTATWLATGNNLTIQGDLSTRVLTCTIDPEAERPEERRFRRNLYDWVPKNRVRLVVAGLTVLRAWYVAGRPKADVPPYGRFESWEPVRHALMWLGFADPCATRQHAEAGDPVREQLREILELWRETFGAAPQTVREVIETAGLWLDRAAKYQYPALREVLLEVGSDRKGNLSSRSLARWIKKYSGRIEDGYRLERADDYGSRAQWKVVSVQSVQSVQSGTATP